MNILAANEIKKHGVSILEKQLRHGPVHVLKHNRPLFVVLSEKAYQSLTSSEHKASGLFAMLDKPVTGKLSKQEIDQQLHQERDQWE
jgi:PHD/YefM family antitoxin component YafN of YafNO toxin-antitoxin module